jgi:hypothetical protein
MAPLAVSSPADRRRRKRRHDDFAEHVDDQA